MSSNSKKSRRKSTHMHASFTLEVYDRRRYKDDHKLIVARCRLADGTELMRDYRISTMMLTSFNELNLETEGITKCFRDIGEAVAHILIKKMDQYEEEKRKNIERLG